MDVLSLILCSDGNLIWRNAQLLAVTIHVIWFLVEFVFPAISWGIQFIEDNISWFDIAVSISSVNCSMLNAQLDGWINFPALGRKDKCISQPLLEKDSTLA